MGEEGCVSKEEKMNSKRKGTPQIKHARLWL